MKLLLTSAGVRNQAIADSLIQLTGKTPGNTLLSFITTARPAGQDRDKYLQRELGFLSRFGFNNVDSLDPSVDQNWQERLEASDAVVMGGGNTFYLLQEAHRNGTADWILKSLGTKVYVGISAGSILVTPNIAIAAVDDGDKNEVGISDLSGLALVPFEVSPHTPEDVSIEANIAYSKTTPNPLYCYDDETAISVVDDEVRFIGTGKRFILE